MKKKFSVTLVPDCGDSKQFFGIATGTTAASNGKRFAKDILRARADVRRVEICVLENNELVAACSSVLRREK